MDTNNGKHKENVNVNTGNSTSSSSSPAASKFSWGGGVTGVVAAAQQQYTKEGGQGQIETSKASDDSGTGSSSSISGGGKAEGHRDGAVGESPSKRSRNGASPRSPRSETKRNMPVTNRRRRMVAECRAIKQEINAYEAEFCRNYAALHGGKGKMPKSSDRPREVQDVYDRYKEMKREIRDSAATDVQRMVRAMQARMKVHAMKENIRRRIFGDIMSLSSVLEAPLGSPVPKEGQHSPENLGDNRNQPSAPSPRTMALATSVEILANSGKRSGCEGALKADVTSSLYTSGDSLNNSSSSMQVGSASTSMNSMSITDASTSNFMGLSATGNGTMEIDEADRLE